MIAALRHSIGDCLCGIASSMNARFRHRSSGPLASKTERPESSMNRSIDKSTHDSMNRQSSFISRHWTPDT
jgi:hypothetical protein